MVTIFKSRSKVGKERERGMEGEVWGEKRRRGRKRRRRRKGNRRRSPAILFFSFPAVGAFSAFTNRCCVSLHAMWTSQSKVTIQKQNKTKQKTQQRT